MSNFTIAKIVKKCVLFLAIFVALAFLGTECYSENEQSFSQRKNAAVADDCGGSQNDMVTNN